MDFNNLINTNILEELYEKESEEFEDYVVNENKENRTNETRFMQVQIDLNLQSY